MSPRILPLALAAALCIALGAQAAPTRVSANAGEVRDILYTTGSGAAGTVYAATYGGGVFKSTTSGTTWSHLPGLSARYVHRLAVNPNVGSTARIYAATENGLFRSLDSGTTWTQLTFDPATAVAVDPGNAASDTVLIGVPGVGIVRAANANTSPTFTRVSSGLDSSDVTKIEYQSSAVAYAVLACNYQDVSPPFKEGNYGGLFRTIDNGSSGWSNVNTLGGVSLSHNNGGIQATKCVSDVATNATTVVATTYDMLTNTGFVQRSVSAAAWSLPTVNLANTGDLFGALSVRRDRNSTTTFWAGSAQVGVWKSTDSGLNWTQQTLNAAKEHFTGVRALETVVGSTTVLGAFKGLGISTAPNTSGTQTWTLATGLTADRVRSLANHNTSAPNTYYMALEQGGVQKSTNAGTAWTPLNTGLNLVYGNATVDSLRSAQAIVAHPGDTNVVAVGMRSLGLYNLSGGTTWTSAHPGVLGQATDHKPQAFVANPAGSRFYYSLFDPAGASGQGAVAGGLYQSTAPSSLIGTGRPIFESNPSLGVAPGSYRVVVSPNDFNRVFFLMYDSEPYRATDGVSFSRVTVTHEGFMRIAFWDIAERPATGVVVGSTNKGIFRSADGGASFSRVAATGLTDFNLSSIAYSSDGRLFGGTLAGGYFCSKDDGTTWAAVSLGGLPAMPVREVRFLNNQIHWLTDGGGIYKSTPATDCP